MIFQEARHHNSPIIMAQKAEQRSYTFEDKVKNKRKTTTALPQGQAGALASRTVQVREKGLLCLRKHRKETSMMAMHLPVPPLCVWAQTIAHTRAAACLHSARLCISVPSSCVALCSQRCFLCVGIVIVSVIYCQLHPEDGGASGWCSCMSAMILHTCSSLHWPNH